LVISFIILDNSKLSLFLFLISISSPSMSLFMLSISLCSFFFYIWDLFCKLIFAFSIETLSSSYYCVGILACELALIKFGNLNSFPLDVYILYTIRDAEDEEFFRCISCSRSLKRFVSYFTKLPKCSLN
jgi:hypothetical protein